MLGRSCKCYRCANRLPKIDVPVKRVGQYVVCDNLDELNLELRRQQTKKIFESAMKDNDTDSYVALVDMIKSNWEALDTYLSQSTITTAHPLLLLNCSIVKSLSQLCFYPSIK